MNSLIYFFSIAAIFISVNAIIYILSGLIRNRYNR